MSNSDVAVSIQAEDQCAELYLVDEQRAVVASGLGHLDTQVPPGFYKVSQRIGDIERSRIIEVSEIAAKNFVRLPALEFTSPIPLQGSTTAREFQQSALIRIGLTHSFGGTGTCFLMIRDARWTYKKPARRHVDFIRAELARLSFETFDGQTREALPKIGVFDSAAGWFIAHLELPPGAYVLVQKSLEENGPQTCLPLEVTKSWSPQIFMQIAPNGKLSLPLDLDRASVVYASRGRHLSPADPDLSLLEVARKALSRGRSAVAADVMERIVNSKFHDPMLGLFGAHLLLDAANANFAVGDSATPNLQRACMVINNTANLLSEDFPDIVALRCRLARIKHDTAALLHLPELRSPPLLAASWASLVAPSVDGGPSCADKSAALRFNFTVVDTTTWFIWREQRGERTRLNRPALTELRSPQIGLPAIGFEPPVKAAFARGLTIDTRNVEYETPPSSQTIAKLLEHILAQNNLQDWLRQLRADERLGKNSDLTALDRSLLSSAASAQASLLPGILDAATAAQTIARSINVPARAAQASASKLLQHLLGNSTDKNRPA